MSETLTRRSMQLLRIMYEKGSSTSTYSLQMKQDELAKQLGISRQALNVHLRKLREIGYIRTGRGFIDVSEKGLVALGILSTPAFILIRALPTKRMQVYEKIRQLKVQKAYRITGDVDALVVVDREKLDAVLKKLYAIDGIQDTRSYVTIETMK